MSPTSVANIDVTHWFSKDKDSNMIRTLWVINYDDMKWELFMIWNEYENELGPLPYVVLLLSFDRIRIYFVTISYYEWQLSHDLGLSKTYLIGRHFENFFIKDFLRRIRYFNTWFTKKVIFAKKNMIQNLSSKRCSQTGNRTRAAWVKARNPNP